MPQNLKNLLWHLPKNFLFLLLNGFPSRKLVLIGVTGTDGKTTTCNLIHQVLLDNGYKAGLISTIGAKIGNQEIATGLHTTSPDPQDVQKLFKRMLSNGITHIVCEVTSHALDQNRFLGCHFTVSALTNISHEHLDYHHTMDHYIRSKSKLFSQSRLALLNRDDQSFDLIRKLTRTPIKTFSIHQVSDYQAKNIKKTSTALSFACDGQKFITDSIYDYQVYNILAAYGICKELGVSPQVFLKTIEKFPATKGRRELVQNELGLTTIIDFAHTPAALENTLQSLKDNTKGKLICIFGATGGRDQTKRPLMGQVVSRFADIAIITSDDTRNEKVDDINAQIIAGIDSQSNPKFKYHNIPNRQDAFNLAVKLAKPGDTIVTCGKGHETSMLHGKTEYPWSEAEAYRTAFRQNSSHHASI